MWALCMAVFGSVSKHRALPRHRYGVMVAGGAASHGPIFEIHYPRLGAFTSEWVVTKNHKSYYT